MLASPSLLVRWQTRDCQLDFDSAWWPSLGTLALNLAHVLDLSL